MKNKEKLNIPKLNEVINLSKNILKVTFIFFCIIGIYAITLILKGVLPILLIILKVISPLFIGIVIAWLLEPGVKRLNKIIKNRLFSSILIYIIMLAILYLIMITLFPLLLEQISDFITILPAIIDYASDLAYGFLEKFNNINLINIEMIKSNVINYINDSISSLTTEIPTMIINTLSNLVSTIGIFALGLIIGFYLLVGSDNISKTLLSLLPIKVRKDINGLMEEANSSLFSYIKGVLLISLIMSIVSAIAFSIMGLKAPILLGLICGVTNIIPYIGPFIGGVIASIVAFTQNISLGILAIVVVLIVQALDNGLLHPLIIGKTMKLHPVIILVSLLIFGYLWGPLGMVIATPLVALFRLIIIFVENKYGIFNNFVKVLH